jgi:signal transduction histidine kinase
MRRPSIARRIALIAAAAAAVTALVSAAVPLVLLGLRLTSADLRTAGNLAAAMDDGITKERAERPTAEGAAREFLYELALDGVRREVWGPSGLIAAKGPGDEVGVGGGAADAEPHREKGRFIARRHTATGLVVAVAVPGSFSNALRREMGTALLLGVLPLSFLSALISVRLTRRALAPLETLAREVAARPSSGPWKPLEAISKDAEVVRLADALNEMGRRLTQALAAEREFAAYAAHALRTPLTRLVAQSHSGMPPSGGALETLRRLVESLLVLVRTDVSLQEAGSATNVADLLRHVAVSRAGGGRAFTVEAPDEVFVRGDEELLVAAIEHLAENAVAYSTPGLPIHLSASERGGIVTVAIRDEGPGVAPEDLERIFEPFVRGRGAEVSTGSGLGLALVRRIAAGHGGSACAVPAGGGTSFELRLPVWRPVRLR